MNNGKFLTARREIHEAQRAGEISERERDDALRLVDADEAQARMLAALPEFPRYGFYVKTGLAGYGPDLDETDMPHDSWDAVASAIAYELSQMAEFNSEGADATAESASAHYQAWQTSHDNPSVQVAADTYHEAWQALKLARELSSMAEYFERLSDAGNPAPVYAGRPELRHARIWNLISENFPLDVSHNSRLYVWECKEGPESEED